MSEGEGGANHRNIFSYFNGSTTVYGDPLTIHRHLTRALDGDPNRVIGETHAGLAGERENYPDEESWQAALAQEVATAPMRVDAGERLIGAIRGVFGMVPFDPATGSGATEKHCMDALEAFVALVEKKNRTG